MSQRPEILLTVYNNKNAGENNNNNCEMMGS